jgi:ABC-type antimicrobial peptide transport system permease subunit
MLTYAVEQRRREFGVRLALGGTPRWIRRRVLAGALGLTLVALVAGLAASLAFGRFLESELFGVRASDPTTLAAAAVTLGCSALLSAWRPAARAARVDPLTLLRSE